MDGGAQVGKTTVSVSWLIANQLTSLGLFISSHDDIQLARFKGRPGEMSPKARFYMFAGWLIPSRFK
jgi:hypothetical protein